MNFEALPADEFLEEAQELLQEIEESLLLLEEDPVDQNVIQRLFRSAHTLKGGAAMVGMSDLANHAHEFEAILSQLRSGTLTSTPEIVSVLLRGKDNLRRAKLLYAHSVKSGFVKRCDLIDFKPREP